VFKALGKEWVSYLSEERIIRFGSSQFHTVNYVDFMEPAGEVPYSENPISQVLAPINIRLPGSSCATISPNSGTGGNGNDSVEGM
jgi:hypothetical protein